MKLDLNISNFITHCFELGNINDFIAIYKKCNLFVLSLLANGIGTLHMSYDKAFKKIFNFCDFL